jgi:putative transposase
VKKQYQIEAQNAVGRLEAMAAEKGQPLQLALPMAEVVAWLQQGVGRLMREAGLQMMQLIMEEEVRQLVGERHQPQPGRQAYRWGKERGFCVVNGQKLPVDRTRVRTTDDREVRLGSYELFRRGEPLDETVWSRLMAGLSTRSYGRVIREFMDAYGIEKSAVSEHFIEASREKVKQLMERRLGHLRLCAMVIDATVFEGQHLVVAIGIGAGGQKTVLGLREGASENATVVAELLSDLMERGVDFTRPRLYVLDGGKALHNAVQRHAGKAALIQRCEVHKKRNVLAHLPEDQQAVVGERMSAAYAKQEYAEAKLDLEKLQHELMRTYPSAARSLAEGMDETLTIHRLGVPPKLRLTLTSTNIIESAFSIVERVCRNVKRWHVGDQRERWVGSGLLVAEQQFRRVKGYREIPRLLSILDAMAPKGVAKVRGAA